ncbi:MAG TPA: 2-C-methyl-D-erythritol 4-phosphate cytidylyltransferase [Ktedonobacterales bacterium]
MTAETRCPATVAIVLGAGQGSRMGAERNKMLLPLAGMPVLAHTLAAFERAPEVTEIVLVAHPREVALCEQTIVRPYALGKVRAVIAGGETRHQSETRALAHLRPRIRAGEVELILIHDGARPLVTPAEIARVIAAARATGGALLASPVAPDETILEIAPDGLVTAGYPPAELARAQTPQGFRAPLLLQAYDQAAADGFEGTDTAASVERLGHAVAIVRGGARNLKITTPDDLLRAEALLRATAGAPGDASN